MEVTKYEGGERLIGNFSYDLADNPTIRQSERIDVHCFQHFLCIRDYLGSCTYYVIADRGGGLAK